MQVRFAAGASKERGDEKEEKEPGGKTTGGK
jgi:hypothetical protein